MKKFDKKRIFYLSKGKKVKLHFKCPFIADANVFCIRIDEYFDEFTKEKQKSIIWHELYHKKINTRCCKFICLFVKSGFNWNKAKKLEEFEADKYAVVKNGDESMISVLKKVKKMVDKKIIPYNLKNHPSVEERIRKIKELKNN